MSPVNGIVKIVLEFGEGYDPNVGFDILSFTTESIARSAGPSIDGNC